MNRQGLFLLLLLQMLTSPFLYSLDEEEEEDNFSIEKESWTVGIALWEQSNLLERQTYLQNSLPQLLKDELEGLKTHLLTDEESLYLRETFLDDKRLESETTLETLFTQRDELIFSDAVDTRSRYESLSEDIKEQFREIERLKGYDPSEVDVPVELDLIFKDMEKSVSLIQVAREMETESYDMILYGSIERLDELLFLELSCFSPLGKEPLASWTGTGGEEDLNSLVREASAEIRVALLGRTWSEIHITAEPAGSLILMDGETVGVGEAHISDASPGFVTISISEHGYISDSRQVFLPAMETVELAVELEKGISSYVSFLSDPPGADVYYGSEWQGITPLSVPRPGFSNDIKIAYEGYRAFHIPSYEVKGDSITVKLTQSAYDKELAFKEAKSDFYRALGWMSISMGVPLILYGIYQNQTNLYYDYAYQWIATDSQESYDKARQYERYSNITYYSFLGGVAVSGGLLVNTLIKLKDYIRAAEDSTED